MKIKGNWFVGLSIEGDAHCVPLWDTYDHSLTRDCVCKPKFRNEDDDKASVDSAGPVIVAHQPYDGRK